MRCWFTDRKLHPMSMSALNRFTISRRLQMIALAFTLPIGVMLSLIVTNINKDIAFSALELEGNEYQRPLEALLSALSESSTSSGASASGRVDAAFAALEAVDARIGGALQFTADGLGQRKREHVRVATVKQEWADLKTSFGQMAPAAVAERHAHLVADVRTMITHVGDTSNLILDPDLDSFYTMDMTLVALPQTQDRITGVMTLAQELAARQTVTDPERVPFAVAAAFLKESDRDRIVADADTALNEDKNFQGTSATLQRNLPPAVKSYAADTTTLIDTLAKAAQSSDRVNPAAITAAGAKAREASFGLWTVAADELDALLTARLEARRQERMWALIFSGLAWAGALAIVFLITRSITRPLAAASVELANSSREVVAASGQLAGSSQSLSQGATEQAASLEETSASMEEMASMTRRNADNSQQAATLMGEVDARVQVSNQSLGDMVAAMASIQESSKQVAKIIKTIDEIAFQTNILALNAAVEAARAGEAGMGFAVVADEVRNLAQRSAQAARDTTALIETAIAKAQDGTRKVEQVAESIAGITDGITSVKGLVEEVSLASRQQAKGIDQVSQAIAQMEKVTQTTAATAEESAAASEELNAQAEGSMAVIRQLEALIGGGGGEQAAAEHKAGAAPRLAPPAKAASMPEDDELPRTGTYGRF
jgi:methyl-accepting chemotaxis protein